MPTVVYSIYHAHLKHNNRRMAFHLAPSSTMPPTAAVQFASDAISQRAHFSRNFSAFWNGPKDSHHTSSVPPTPTIATPSTTTSDTPSDTPVSPSSPSSTPSTIPSPVTSSSDIATQTPSAKVYPPLSSTSPAQSSSSGDAATLAATSHSVSASTSGPSAVSVTSAQSGFTPTTLTTTIVKASAGTTYAYTLTSVESSAPTQAALAQSSALVITAGSSAAPQGIESKPSVTSSASTASASTSSTSHQSPLALILGTSIGGGMLITVAIAVCIVCLIRRHNARGRHHIRAASRNESFFAPERPLVSPFPTLSRPQSHATVASMANTLNDEERWAEYRNAYQSPPLLPGAGIVSRDTLLFEHHVEALSPPAQMQDMGYAILSRSSPLSATFPNEQHVVSPTPSHMPLLPEDASSIRAAGPHAYSSFIAPDSTSSPTSASFAQYIVYDGIDVGSVADTLATPSGQRIPLAATNSHDSSLQSSGVFSARGSLNSLRSDGSAGSIHPDESSMGMAI